MEELFNQLPITVDANLETEPNVHLIINVEQQTLYTKQWYQHSVNQIRNISILQRLRLKIALEATQEIFVSKNMLTALNFLNTCGN